MVVLSQDGVLLTTIDIAGEYLGRIYDEVKRHPSCLVDDLIGAERETEQG